MTEHDLLVILPNKMIMYSRDQLVQYYDGIFPAFLEVQLDQMTDTVYYEHGDTYTKERGVQQVPLSDEEHLVLTSFIRKYSAFGGRPFRSGETIPNQTRVFRIQLT